MPYMYNNKMRHGKDKLETIYASPPRGNAILAGPLSNSDAIMCCCGIPIGLLC